MSTLRLNVPLAVPDDAALNGVRVDLWPASALERELGGPPEADSAPAATPAATVYTTRGQATATSLTPGAYWARVQWKGGGQWQLCQAGRH